MTRAVARLFADRPSAEQAVADFTGADVDHADAGVVMQDKIQTKEKARTPLYRVPPALLIALALVAPAAGVGHTAAAQDAVGVSCAARVAVLGADLTPVGRAAVRQTLGLSPGETALTESLVDERVQAHGLIPPALLGVVAVSSVVLRPAPTGSGLRVTLDRNITRYPAQAYANALLIAGVSDAAVSIAAPSTQRTLGTTALLGVLRAARLSCGATNGARQDLAVRAFVLTDALAARTGAAAAPLLMTRLTADAATGHVTAPGALATLVDTDAARLRLSVPSALRPDIARFLGDLTASHVYDAVAAAGPRVGGAPPLQAVVSFARPLGQTVPGGRGTTTTPPTGQIYRGTAAAGASLSALGVRLAGGPVGGLRLFRRTADAPVYRDGARVTLTAIQRGDMVTVTTDATGRVTRIDDVSHGGASAETVIHGTLPVAVRGAPLAVQEGSGTRTYHTAPGVQVSRDGRPSTLAALRPHDRVAVTTNAAGAVTRIDATSTGGGAPQNGGRQGAVVRGTGSVVTAAASTVAVVEADGSHTYRTTAGVIVSRDGKPSTFAAIQPGDSVAVTTDASGRAVRIDATSRPTRGSGAVHRGIAAAGLVAGAAGVTVREDAGTRTYHIARVLQVSRNGKPSTLGAIQSGDSVVVTTDASGQATRIDAASHAGGARGGLYHGTVAVAVAVGASTLAVKEAGGTRTYHVAPGAPVYRDGRPKSLGDLKATDTVTGTNDAAGVTTRLDATSVPAPAVVSNPLLPALGALAVFLLLGLLLLARRRRRPPIVTTTMATGAAVIPALERPASEPLRARLHDGKDLAE